MPKHTVASTRQTRVSARGIPYHQQRSLAARLSLNTWLDDSKVRIGLLTLKERLEGPLCPPPPTTPLIARIDFESIPNTTPSPPIHFRRDQVIKRTVDLARMVTDTYKAVKNFKTVSRVEGVDAIFHKDINDFLDNFYRLNNRYGTKYTDRLKDIQWRTMKQDMEKVLDLMKDKSSMRRNWDMTCKEVAAFGRQQLFVYH
jgi:hypothetical protein